MCFMLIGEITTHKFTKIFRYCQFFAWQSSDKIYYETYKKGLSNIV